LTTLTIQIPDALLVRVDEYCKIHQKPSISEAVREILDDVFTLPTYFDGWDWNKVEAEADEAIEKGEVIGPFDNIKDALKSLKETRV
jgi:hypothetical protein